MPRSGGESDKLGNRYEGTWTVGRLLELAHGKSASLTVEPFGDEAFGIEFIVRRADGTRGFHSVKRQRAKGEWSPFALTQSDKSTGRSILGDLFGKLTKDEMDQCWFVSSTGANMLRELSERASQRESFARFRDDLNSKGSDTLRGSFEKYILPLSSDWEAAYQCLRQLRVVLIDEASLTAQVDQYIAFLIYRPDMRKFEEAEVRLLLGDFVLRRLGTEIEQKSVWEHLSEFGYEQRDWATDATVQAQVRNRNEEYLRAVEIDLINGERVPRAEAQRVVKELAVHGWARTVLVSAPAGYGKSCVIAQAFAELDSQASPVLIVRMDQHGGARTTQDIGTQMGLPRSPAIVLAGLANGGPCVLFVDQLDAVSQVSGRYPHLWEVFDSLCREAAAYPNMRVVVACRDFDLENDHRLRKLKQPETVKHVQVPLLSIEDVDAALTTSGCESAQLDQRQKEILQTPLHLFLFLDGLDDSTEAAFRSIGELFDRFWKRKQKQVSARLGHEAAWTALVDKLCDGMSRDLALYVPVVEVDEWNDTVDAMLTEHVLVCEQKRIRFFHESFFDYAFARRFCASGKTLLDLLHSGEQHLFRRSQVRQILVFLRDHADRRYCEQLRAVLTDDNIRFHIKRMVFAWLGALPEPTADEWAILEPLLLEPDYRRHALPPVRNSLPWFDRLHELGVVSRWLASSDEDTANTAIWLLMLDDVQQKRSETAAALLAPYRGRGPNWDTRLRHYFSYGNAHHSREIQELFLALLADGIFDESAPDGYDSWWHRLAKAEEEAPLFVLDAIAHWLDRRIAEAPDSPDENLFPREDGDHFAPKLINDVASREPRAYIEEILPRVLQILSRSEQPTEFGLKLDRVWGSPWNGEPFYAKDALLAELSTAFETLAEETPNEFEALAKDLVETEWMTIAVLLLRAWSANPARFATDCIEFLLADPQRLDIGYGSWSGDGIGHAAVSREAVQTCLPFASQDQHERLERVIIGFHAYGEAGEHEGWTERLLLEAFGEDNLSRDGRSRLAVLREKFPNQETGIPLRRTGGAAFVGSPIPEDETKQLTDEQWLAAMREYDYGWDDLAGRDRAKGRMRGSAVELSRELGPEARRNRRRFAALISQMDDSIRPEYFTAILDGICGMWCNLAKEERTADEDEFQRLEIEVVLEVMRRLHGLPNRPCGRSICLAFRKLADRDMPESDLQMVEYYAIEDADPTGDHWLEEDSTGNHDSAENAHMRGYNSVRGGAARAIKSLLFADYSRSKLLLPLLRRMVSDPSLSVRTCVVESLLPVLNHDRNEAVELFIQACEGAELIFGCDTFENFARYASSTHYSQLRDMLLRALESSCDSSVSAAARQFCLAAFKDEAAEDDAAAIRSGNDLVRRSAAQVYSFNVANPVVGSTCQQYLPELFNDASTEVRNEAASCFRHMQDANFNEFIDLVRAYVESKAFPSSHDSLLHQLEDSPWQLPDITIRIAERFVAAHGTDAGDMSTAASADAPTVSKLVVRLYTQTGDDATRTTCLDLIDEMERIGFYGIDSQLAEHDR